ncbi:MAG: hypothetical protein J6Y78_01670 [Paludibacteraceae bacterium]|nr:hypothetical protein [Paludibacteraceae bacterium]
MMKIENYKNIADEYLKWIGKNFEYLRNKFRKFCTEKSYEFDEDIFSDTYMKVYETICRNGLEDNTERGFDNYTFKSFKQNLQREKQYARNEKRDRNFTSDEVDLLYEKYINQTENQSLQKLRNDLYIDFATLYIMSKVEEHFDEEHFYLFRIKTLGNLTYKQLQQKTKIKSARQKVIDVKNFLKNNVTKEEINDAFQLMYGDLL